MFVGAADVLYNTEFIATLRRVEGGTLIRFQDGTEKTITIDFEDVAFGLGPVLPENSGTRSLHLEVVDREVQHFTRPIIGWRMSSYGPVALSPTGEEPEYLLYSDGTVDWVGFGRFSSVGEAIDDFERRRGRNPA